MSEVLGVKIDDVSLGEAVEQIETWLGGKGKHFIVTPNPEFLVIAQKDKDFKDILNNADLAIPDGVGLKFSGIKNTVPGTDLMGKLIELAAEKGFTVGLLGGRSGVADILAKRLKKIYQNISVAFAGSNDNQSKIPPVDLLFVAFGAPKQEKWIADNLEKVPAKVMMGVGGAFDYLTGKVPRAPKWVRDLGFEWLFRLIVQPWRIRRQLSLLKYLILLMRDSSE